MKPRAIPVQTELADRMEAKLEDAYVLINENEISLMKVLHAVSRP